ALGLITAHHQEQQDSSGQEVSFAHHYRYDSAGRLLSRTLAGGQVLSYGYDNAGRTVSVRLQRPWRRLIARIAGEELADSLTGWLPEVWRHRSVVAQMRHRPFDAGLTALQELVHGNGEHQQWTLPKAMPAAPVPVSGSARDALEHDAYGRQTRHTPASGPHRGIPLQLVWNDGHQLVEVSQAQNATPIARYRYDSFGNR